MSVEDELRSALRREAGAAPDARGIDVRAAVAASRARRRPKDALLTAAGSLAVVGVLAVVVPTALRPISAVSTADAPVAEQAPLSEEAAGAASDDAALTKRAPAERLAACAGPMPESAPSTSGLELELALPAAIAPGATATGVARLTNPTGATVTGWTTASAAAYLGVDGVVAWRTPASPGLLATPFALEPGASVELPVAITAVMCSAEDDLVAIETGAFPPDLAALPPGEATVVVAIDVRIEEQGSDAPALLDLVRSAPVTIAIAW